jgi:uncharacterized protein YegP (UPF0339 family)
MRVEIYQGTGMKNWRVRLVADNGQIFAISEGYATKWNAQRAARRIFPDLEVIVKDKGYRKFP